jgi:dTDP-4-dehydrorhamnose reductase
MRMLVTGVNGLVGSRLAALLGVRGNLVIGLGQGPQRSSFPGEYVSVNLSDEAALAATVHVRRPQVVINVGSMTDVDACELDASQALRVNGIAPGILALAAFQIGAHLVQVSTDYVFDGEAGPYSEDGIPNPRGVYALTKHIGEQAVRAVGASWAVARTAVVYGWPPAARANFGTWLLEALRKGSPVHLFEDQFVSPSLAENVAEQIAELAERRLAGFWNTCGAEVVSRVQFGHALCAEFGLDPTKIVPACTQRLAH